MHIFDTGRLEEANYQLFIVITTKACTTVVYKGKGDREECLLHVNVGSEF